MKGKYLHRAHDAILMVGYVLLGSCEGRNIEKQVPLLLGRTLLRIFIEPPSRFMIPFATQRPSPVPFSPLVVKKGSKTRATFSVRIPTPLSAMVSRTPWIAEFRLDELRT